MKRRYSILASLLFFCLLSSAVAGEEFRVGVTAPLTGALAEYGVATRNGITMAVAEHPSLFSSIEFLFEDNEYAGKTAVTVFRKLTEQEQVNLIYDWGAASSEAIAPLADRANVPLVSLSGLPSVTKGRRFVVGFFPPSQKFGATLADYLSRQSYRNIGVVKTEIAFLNEVFQGLKLNLHEGHELTVIDSFDPGAMDFRTTVSKVKKAKFDAIGVFLISGQVALFHRQMKDQRVEVPTFGTDFFDSKSEIEKSAGGMEGAVYPFLNVDESFRERYEAKFGNDVMLATAGSGYDFAMVVGRLFNNVPASLSKEEVLAALEKVQPFTGVLGRIEFKKTDAHGKYFSFPIVMKQIKVNTISVLKDLAGRNE